MTLFPDDRPDGRWGARRRWSLGGWLLTIALVGAVAFSLVPSPYVIERPGPVFNTLGNVEVAGRRVPMIAIPTQQTYPTKGSLDLLTVNFVGNRAQLPNWFQVVTAWFDPSEAVMPLDSVYPPGVSVQDADKQGAIEMSNSQKEAIAAALTHLGEHLQSSVTVAGLSPQSPSEGKLRANDIIRSVGGVAVDDVAALRAAIAAGGTGKPLTIEITRAGRDESVTVVPGLSHDASPVPILGIYAAVDYTLPFPVSIELENVGGPSAGQMFALGIIDKLTPGALTGGKSIAGTGTIDASGTVGKIGGIRQKLRGAKQAGAKWFLAPSGNCNEVAGHVPDGLRVFAVRNLDDSLAALKAISTGSGLDALATCGAR